MKYIKTAAIAFSLLLFSNIAVANKVTSNKADRTANQHNVATSAYSVVNINQADEAQIATLKGIGTKRAKAIIAYRETHGDFSTMAELLNVKGIGKSVLDKNRAVIRL